MFDELWLWMVERHLPGLRDRNRLRGVSRALRRSIPRVMVTSNGHVVSIWSLTMPDHECTNALRIVLNGVQIALLAFEQRMHEAYLSMLNITALNIHCFIELDLCRHDQDVVFSHAGSLVDLALAQRGKPRADVVASVRRALEVHD